MTETPVLAATAWNTNADMIVDVVRLGYIKPDDAVIDLTFGKGNWWSKWYPRSLQTNDLDPDSPAELHEDFRDTDWADDLFDVVAYDPPYVCVGGRKTTGMAGMHAAYGMTGAPSSPAKLQRLIYEGLKEAARICKAKGIILVKCQDYISSGKLWPGVFNTQANGYMLGLETVDILHHTSKAPRPQPPGRRQVHARRNLSTLLVFRKPRG